MRSGSVSKDRPFIGFGQSAVEQLNQGGGTFEAGDDLFGEAGRERELAGELRRDAPLALQDEIEGGVVFGEAFGAARHPVAVEGSQLAFEVFGADESAVLGVAFE